MRAEGRVACASGGVLDLVGHRARGMRYGFPPRPLETHSCLVSHASLLMPSSLIPYRITANASSCLITHAQTKSSTHPTAQTNSALGTHHSALTFIESLDNGARCG